MPTVPCPRCHAHCTMPTAPCSRCHAHGVMPTVPCTRCHALCTMLTVACPRYDAHCTMLTVPCPLCHAQPHRHTATQPHSRTEDAPCSLCTVRYGSTSPPPRRHARTCVRLTIKNSSWCAAFFNFAVGKGADITFVNEEGETATQIVENSGDRCADILASNLLPLCALCTHGVVCAM